MLVNPHSSKISCQVKQWPLTLDQHFAMSFSEALVTTELEVSVKEPTGLHVNFDD